MQMKKINLKDPLNLAKALIRCPSETPNDEGAIFILKMALEQLGFSCKILSFGNKKNDGKNAFVYNLYAKIGNGKNLCFAGHTDVVPAGPLTQWKYSPYEARVSKGFLYGRGASDMKGAIAAFVAASARYLNKKNNKFSISFLITGDEEGYAINGTRAVLPKLKIMRENIDHCIVGEPTNPSRLGEMIKVGRRGSLHGKIQVEGKQGHVAYPNLAVNPIPYLAQLVTVLSKTKLDRGNKFFQPSNIEFVTVDTGNVISNVIPNSATAIFNIRYNNLYTEKSLVNKIRDIIKTKAPKPNNLKLTLDTDLSGEPFLTSSEKFINMVADAIKEETNIIPTLSTSGGTSDARFIKDICPVIEFGSVGKTMHQINEGIFIKDLEKLTQIYENILNRYGKHFS